MADEDVKRRGPGPSHLLMTPDHAGNVVGIDPHERTLSATVADARGGILASAHFRVSGDGHRELEAWARQFGQIARWGIEGSGAGGGTRRCSCQAVAMTCVMCARIAHRGRSRAPARQVRRAGLRADRPRDVGAPAAAQGVQARGRDSGPTSSINCWRCGTTGAGRSSPAASTWSARPSLCCASCRSSCVAVARHEGGPPAPGGARAP